MPTYNYVCDACQYQFERFQAITEKPVKKCPECGRPKVRRLITGGAGLIFKGSGFYQTDYRSKSYHEAAEKDRPSSKAPAEKGSCGPSECKQPDVCSPEKKSKKK